MLTDPHPDLRLDLGSLFATDSEGYLVPVADTARIPHRWQPVLDEAIAAYRTHAQDRLHSIYVRGSVVRGQAVDGVSDLDTMAIYATPWTTEGGFIRVEPWASTASQDIARRHPLCSDVELCAVSLDDLFTPRGTFCRFMLQTSCIAVYGTDIRTQLPRYRPDTQAWSEVWNLRQDLIDTRAACAARDPDIRGWCRWMCKGLVRAGLELSMRHEPVYTRDLVPCWQVFSAHYPEHRDSMRRLVELAIWPTDDPDLLMDALQMPVVAVLEALAAEQGPSPWAQT